MALPAPAMKGICRDCARLLDAPAPLACPACGGTRLYFHPELHDLAIAHMDCDAFYAAVEKRDDPSIRGRPVIVGGGRRGVVSACCYIARINGVRSAMPMFKALAACPDAVVIRPNMEKYRVAGEQVRRLMQDMTPLVEPLSIDEAFLDLSGTTALHGGPPAQTLVKLAKRIETEIGVTASIGLSFNKFLAKLSSDIDKPRGFAAVGRAEAVEFLAEKPVGILWGVGRSLRQRLERDGIHKVGQLRDRDMRDLVARYGTIGERLWRFARAEDFRRVEPESDAKSISAETTFEDDVDDLDTLKAVLWRLAEKVARRLRRAELATDGVQLKLKQADFKLLTRSRKLPGATRLADDIYAAASDLLAREADGRKFRLIGIGADRLVDGDQADRPDLADPDRARRTKVADAMEAVRAKFGDAAIGKGRGFRKEEP